MFLIQGRLCQIFPKSSRLANMESSHGENLNNIKKLDDTKFPFSKKKIWQVLVQKKQIKPIKLKDQRPEGIKVGEWEDLDELACSTIMLTLSENVYFNVAKETMAYGVWQKLGDLYEKQSAASQIY